MSRHHPDCTRPEEWPACCGTAAQVEEFYDEVFEDYHAEDYNAAEAEEQ